MQYLIVLFFFIPLCSASSIDKAFSVSTNINMMEFYDQFSISAKLDRDKLNLIYDEFLDTFKDETVSVLIESNIPSSESYIGISYTYILIKNNSTCVSPTNLNNILHSDFIDISINDKLLELSNTSSPYEFNSISISGFNASVDVMSIHTNIKLKGDEGFILQCNGQIEFSVELEL